MVRGSFGSRFEVHILVLPTVPTAGSGHLSTVDATAEDVFITGNQANAAVKMYRVVCLTASRRRPLTTSVSALAVQRSVLPKVVARCSRRTLSSKAPPGRGVGISDSNKTTATYLAAVATFILGVSYASVPLYKVFCQMTGFGGTTQRVDEKKASTVKPVSGAKLVRVTFSSSVHSELGWKFIPTQREVKVVPGETALAFYTVTNPHDRAITGVATYNVHPPKAGLYFSKIQCFCFEEQRLGAKEEIDMPVFFYIDPDFVKDPSMENVNNITLSYTFFKTGEEEPETTPTAKAAVGTAAPKPAEAAATGAVPVAAATAAAAQAIR